MARVMAAAVASALGGAEGEIGVGGEGSAAVDGGVSGVGVGAGEGDGAGAGRGQALVPLSPMTEEMVLKPVVLMVSSAPVFPPSRAVPPVMFQPPA